MLSIWFVSMFIKNALLSYDYKIEIVFISKKYLFARATPIPFNETGNFHWALQTL